MWTEDYIRTFGHKTWWKWRRFKLDLKLGSSGHLGDTTGSVLSAEMEYKYLYIYVCINQLKLRIIVAMMSHQDELVHTYGGETNKGTGHRESVTVLRDMLNVFVFVYLDDILIFSRDKATHVHHVRQVLECPLEHQLYVKAEKCGFHVSSVLFPKTGAPRHQGGLRLQDSWSHAFLSPLFILSYSSLLQVPPPPPPPPPLCTFLILVVLGLYPHGWMHLL